jgi:hypothetical protein
LKFVDVAVKRGKVRLSRGAGFDAYARDEAQRR